MAVVSLVVAGLTLGTVLWLRPWEPPPKLPDHTLTCLAIYIPPHARLVLPRPLKTVGDYEVTLNADGKAEQCRVSIKSVGAAGQQGDVKTAPTTQADNSCKLIRVVEFTDDGSLGSFWTVGTPRSIHVKVSREGEVYSDGTATPDYIADECGFIQPEVQL